MNQWRSVMVVYAKELIDAMRDRRTLLVVFASSVLMGPLILWALSGLIASMEAKAEARTVVVAGIEHAPSLKNYIERQTWTIQKAPGDYETLLRKSKLADPVVVVGPEFESELSSGDVPQVQVLSDSSNKQSQSAVHRVAGLLRGFGQERAALTIALRGVSAELMQPLQVHEVDLANTQSRAAQFTGMLAFFVLLAVVGGSLSAALDTTAGERERGSMEPLLTNPLSHLTLVLGKWCAVSSVGMLIAALSCLSFLPGQWMLQSDTLQAMFQFGPREVGMFLIVLLPFAAAASAILMAVAIHSKSIKEGQANTTVVMMAVSLLPVVSIFNQTGEEPWHLWVPALAQNTLMMRVLRGESFTAAHWVIPFVVCVLVTVACLLLVARRLREVAVK